MKRLFQMTDKFKAPCLRSSSHGTRLRSGQVAVILIVTIAVGLVLFAASINLTLVSQSKTLTMKAASASASQLASALASYGQKQFVEVMGGRKEYCKKSSGGLISIIVLIILVIITIACWGGCAGFTSVAAGGMTSLGAAAAVAAVMQGISIVVAATTDPGISEAWNKMIDANLSQTGQFVERGIMVGLQSAVTDSGKIPDLYDEDNDGTFGYQGDDINNPANDEISRFAHNITRRYLGLQGADTAATNAFITALHDLISDPSDGFAFVDPVYYPDSGTKAPGHSATHLCYQNFFKDSPPDAPGTPNPLYSQRPAECDPCCQQVDEVDPLNTACSAAAGVDQIGDRATCGARAFFRAPGNLYQYVYDPTYEDSTNAFLSFREQMGRDDENQNYHTVQVKPNWHEDPVNQPQQLIIPPSLPGFSLTDVVGYYTAPGFPANTDQWVSPRPLAVNVVPDRPKIYPFLYKVKDWGIKLSAVTYDNYECNLCDANKPANPGRDCPADLSPEIGRLALSFDPSTVAYNKRQGWCVNNTNITGPLASGPDDPPVVPDNVTDIPGLIVPAADCAMPVNTTTSGISDITQYVKGWKPGADRYCSNAVDTDYSRYCPKNDADKEAVCSGAPPYSDWPDDMLDEITYGEIPTIFAIEESLWQVKTAGNLKQLAAQIDDWYGKPAPGDIRANDGIADWIEPPCPDPGNCPGSFTKLERPGRLWVWRELFIEFRSLLNGWLRPSDAGKPNYVSSTCFGPGAVWCVQSNPCPGANAAETATYDFNSNGDIGDLEDVVECLKWNANDVFIYPDTTTATGNAQKFAKCFNTCNQGNCSNLPRSLVPDFYTHLPLEFYPGDEALFNACLTSTIATCNAACSVVPTGAPYNIAPPFVPPDGPQIAAIDAWCSNPVTNVSHLNNACNGGGALYCNANLEGQPSNEDACRCSWANDCTLSTTCGTLCPLGSFCDKVTQAIIPSRGSCGNAQAPAFFVALQQSATEAQVQVDKFRQRLKFLQGRSDEAEAIKETLTTAIDKLTAFLDNGTPDDFTDSPAEIFIQSRMAPLEDTTKDLPSFAIYVWQDKDPISMNPSGAPRWGTGQGYWHAVKAEVRLPRRCAGNCLSDDWPKVDSKTSGGFFSKKVCYKLINLAGMTKARVIRYDQDKDLTGLAFPGGAAIWESRLSNPTLSSAPDPTGLRVTCAGLIDTDLALWLGGATDKKHIGAAFMLNKIPDYTTPGDYEDCWTQVHQKMLAHGVMSEACAQYYFVDDGSGFHVKFVPCDNW